MVLHWLVVVSGLDVLVDAFSWTLVNRWSIVVPYIIAFVVSATMIDASPLVFRFLTRQTCCDSGSSGR